MENVQLATVKWIPFNRLENVQKIGEGGFGSVFSAMWLDGKRDEPFAPEAFVANPKNFLKFKSYMRFRLSDSNLEVYGLTQTTTNNVYF
ncbi:hypothetical protein C2G38_2167206 [Gigaspora rosea]|uniref:Protein kinase domain-containing protein n=1 Tax=Gigaspora rosea TaxID=44941 RepID=A0A397VSP8_9GLOM|nr:hypothetical protein C2G38_2167206 [Gigaspora rosea]